MKMGITIRKGASGFTLSGPEGSTDLSSLNRNQLGTLAAMVSDAIGLEQRYQPRRPRRFHRNTNRKG